MIQQPQLKQSYSFVLALLWAITSLLSACKSEPKPTLDGNPILSGDGKLVPTTPLEEPVKDTSQLHEMRKMTEAIMSKNKEDAEPIAAAPSPAPAPIVYAPPPPLPKPLPTPAPVDISKIMEAVKDVEQLEQRANNALQIAQKAEQRAKAAQTEANLAENQANDKKCAELSNIKKETQKVENATEKVSVKAANTRKATDRITAITNEIQKIKANPSPSFDMAKNAQSIYNNLITDLAKAEKEAEGAATEAGNAETAAYNAKNLLGNCKTETSSSATTVATSSNINKNKIKTNLEQNLMDLSRNPRNVRIISDIKDYFDNTTQKGIIETDKGKYSVEQYITTLNLSGAMDIKISSITVDNAGKVSHVVIEATKLGK